MWYLKCYSSTETDGNAGIYQEGYLPKMIVIQRCVLSVIMGEVLKATNSRNKIAWRIIPSDYARNFGIYTCGGEADVMPCENIYGAQGGSMCSASALWRMLEASDWI